MDSLLAMLDAGYAVTADRTQLGVYVVRAAKAGDVPAACGDYDLGSAVSRLAFIIGVS